MEPPQQRPSFLLPLFGALGLALVLNVIALMAMRANRARKPEPVAAGSHVGSGSQSGVPSGSGVAPDAGSGSGSATAIEDPPKTNPKQEPKKETGPPWRTPKVLWTNNVGSWNLQPGSLIGKCPAGPQYAMVRLGWNDWRDYEVRFEIELQQGDLGFFMRNMARTAQFPGFLTRVGVKQGTGEWFAVHARAQGSSIEVRIRPLGTERGDQREKVLRQTDRPPGAGSFGFVLHSAGEVNIRALQARPIP